MATIKIYPDKIIRSFDEKDSKDEWVDAEHLHFYMGDYVELDEGVTLKRVMDLLREDIPFYQILFNVELGSFSLEAYLDDMDAPIERGDDDDEHLESVKD